MNIDGSVSSQQSAAEDKVNKVKHGLLRMFTIFNLMKSIVFLVCLVALTYSIYDRIDRYLNRNIVCSESYEPPTKIPDVILCLDLE